MTTIFNSGLFSLISGIVFIAAGVSIFIRRKARLASMLLAGMLGINIIFHYIPELANSSWFLQVILHQLALAAGALTWAGIFVKKEVENTYENLENIPESGLESSIEAPTESAD